MTAKLCKTATMLDVEFSPHPCEIVGGHRIVAVSAVKRPVLQVLFAAGILINLAGTISRFHVI